MTNFQKGVDKSAKVWYNDYSERERQTQSQILIEKVVFYMRITKDILRIKVENINNQLGLDVHKFALNYAYEGVRLCRETNEHGGYQDISERMTNSEMAKVLDAMYNAVIVARMFVAEK